MSQMEQERRCCTYSLKSSCILVGSLNALISLVLFAVMCYLSIILAILTNGFLDPGERPGPMLILSIVVIFILLTKFILDVLFVYAVVKKRPLIIKVYFCLSLTIFTLVTAFTIYLSVVNENAGVSVSELLFYSIDVVTIFLSYFYVKELERDARDEV